MSAKLVYALVLVFVTTLAVGFLNIAYTNHVDERRAAGDRSAAKAARSASCDLVVAFDELYKETPPSTPAGTRVAEVWARYRALLNCP
jgi:hypothetical protein